VEVVKAANCRQIRKTLLHRDDHFHATSKSATYPKAVRLGEVGNVGIILMHHCNPGNCSNNTVIINITNVL
jgi:hypothetical protein